MKIGIIGGGQLGMMLVEAAKKKGDITVVLDPNPECSCAHLCDELIVSDYDNLESLEYLNSKVDVITYEFENVSSEALKKLAETNKLKQGILPLEISQNRIKEKKFAIKNGLKTVNYREIYNKEDLINKIKDLKLPVIYKTATLGYDGHGQYMIKNLSDIDLIDNIRDGVIEEVLDFDYEASVILIASKEEISYLPVSKNISKKGILDLTIVDDNLSINDEIIKMSIDFIKKSQLEGIITLEYFIKDNKIYFNEMAPRPHNSGHYSIEALDYSQYDLLLKYLKKEALIIPKLLHKAVMKNILGYNYDIFNEIKESNKIFKHDYFKKDVKKYRKMAHVTYLDITYDEYIEKYNNLYKED